VSTQTAKLPREQGESQAKAGKAPQEISPRMFDNPILEWGSRVHPIVPPLIYIPVISFLLSVAVNAKDLSVPAVAGVFVLGIAFWSLFEYTLHRFIFHLRPDNDWGRKMHFIIHGVHHDHPNDKMRLVMPPGASIPLALLFAGIFWLIFGIPTGLPLFAGFLVGYLMYDYTHYYLHHAVPKTDFGKRLREQHMRHHFQDHRYGFGVSTPFWDAVFGTLPRRRS
jgi:dihydroceramide fatty acyl 2-hydroxylase